ncbi:ATP-binding protein [Dorea formicigenerans]|uniref:ATP-binding protein n=1 Tax=Dorea formicigenerans TaxID=39486 RepID=UPI00156E182B|nr:type IV secretion system DNA-binding domain-containing protein [Dorea formicigenerans]NSK20049.1 ATP-binding protein [Dorea formicigenerans]
MVVGRYKKIPVCVSEKAPNEHIAIFGMSGTGKSTRIAEIVGSAVKEEKTIIALDLSGNDFKRIDGANYISAVDDGIKMELLKSESPLFTANMAGMLAEIFHFGVNQLGVLQVAMEMAANDKNKYDSDLTAIMEALKLQSSRTADGVYNRLKNIHVANIIRESKKGIIQGAINVISFQGLSVQSQNQMSEIYLSLLWSEIKTREILKKEVVLVIDEFQKYIKKNSVLLDMLRESRKYGVSIVLATQSVEELSARVKAAVNQTAVQLFFRVNPANARKIAEMIEPSRVNEMTAKLKKLEIGESIATGNLCIGEREIDDPVIIHSEYGQVEQKKQQFPYLLGGHWYE